MFGLPDSSLSDALKTQLDAQISFYSRMSLHALENMREMTRLNALASKAVYERLLAGTGQYLGANNETRSDQNQAVAEETQAGIVKIVDTVLSTPVSEAIAGEAPSKVPEVMLAAEQQKDVFEKVAVRMSQTSEHSVQGNSKKPAH
jgi:hypothetical protein